MDLDTFRQDVYPVAMIRFEAALSVLGLLAVLGCASPKDAAAPEGSTSNVFQFAPRVGESFVHVMTRREEMAIVGTPLREIEEWKLTWNVTYSNESNGFLMRGELQGLALSVNGAALLVGDEVATQKAFVEILLDKDGQVIDVRRTETLTEAIASVARPEAAEVVRAIFGPEQLRMHFAGLVAERAQDLIGQKATVGSTWEGRVGDTAPAKSTLRVTKAEPCGEASCVRVSRDTEVDPKVVWLAAEADVLAHVKASGGDPSAVSLDGAEIELVDELVVEPATMQFHHATFKQDATVSVATPSGPLTVTSSVHRESSYEF